MGNEPSSPSPKTPSFVGSPAATSRPGAGGPGGGSAPPPAVPAAPAAPRLKVVLLGARGVGKSALVRRVLGERFDDAYTPTASLTRSRFSWKVPHAAPPSRVDVDVVERPEEEEEDDVPASARGAGGGAAAAPLFADAAAVVIMFDVRRRNTFAAVDGLAAVVPPALPLLCVGNKRDAPDGERETNREDIEAWVRAQRRSAPERCVHGIEASMLDLYGLKAVHSWFELPYNCARAGEAEAEAAAGGEGAHAAVRNPTPRGAAAAVRGSAGRVATALPSAISSLSSPPGAAGRYCRGSRAPACFRIGDTRPELPPSPSLLSPSLSPRPASEQIRHARRALPCARNRASVRSGAAPLSSAAAAPRSAAAGPAQPTLRPLPTGRFAGAAGRYLGIAIRQIRPGP